LTYADTFVQAIFLKNSSSTTFQIDDQAAVTGHGNITSIDLLCNTLVPNDAVAFDYLYICSKAPLTLSAVDVANGTVTRVGTGGVDHCQLRLNNWKGKYITGANAIGQGDHLHIYLGQAATLYHVYGGYVENLDPNLPNDMVDVQSRGYGVALLMSIYLKQYATSTPQTIINDIVDNSINLATKDGIVLSTGYQITRSYVQNLGASLGLFSTTQHNAQTALHDLTDIMTVQGSPAAFFVDPAENLHLVPIGPSGSPNWTTDPFPATYGTTLAVGVNQITNKFQRDIKSLRNRVKYYGVAQFPENYDAWTEGNSASWGTERLGTNVTATLSDPTSPVFMGSKSIQCHLDDHLSNGVALNGAVFYPSAKNLGLDFTKLGSAYAPPIFDFCIRLAYAGNIGADANIPQEIFFATDATNRFEYNLISSGAQTAQQSILNIQGPGAATQNFWYHIMLPVGPNGGTAFFNTPVLNTLLSPTFTGPSQYLFQTVGTPNWNNINYIGFYSASNAVAGAHTADFYFDAWRILGGRYYIAYDNRTVANGRYPDMREIPFTDPISKGDTLLQNYAKGELLRLRNTILRGGIHLPVFGDIIPEQQVTVTAPSANLSSTPLRVQQVIHRFSNKGLFTELQLTDDFTNSQPLEPFKIANAMLQLGENAYFSRELFDLKVFMQDPQLSPILLPVI
jgi:hypothetical protein